MTWMFLLHFGKGLDCVPHIPLLILFPLKDYLHNFEHLLLIFLKVIYPRMFMRHYNN